MTFSNLMVGRAEHAAEASKKSLRRILVQTSMLASGLVLAGTTMVSAEDEVASDVIVLDEIVVQARKRAESLQEVPISITAFSSAKLDALQAASLKDIKNFIPSLHYSDRSALQTEITIRGVGGDSRNIGIESGIGLYVDGVYAGRTSGYNIDLADVEQIEVLRGPQGTLFGKNTTGGALNIITRKPSDEFESSVSFSYGNFDAIRAKGSVSGPLSEDLSVKLIGATWDRDGYLTNLFNGEDLQSEERRAAMIQLRYQPSEALDILFSADWTTDDQNVILNQLGSDASFGNGFFNEDRFLVNTDQQNSIERDLYGFSLSVDYELSSGLTVTSISALRDIEITVFSDIDQTPNNVLNSGPFTDNGRQFTQELRLTSPGGEYVDYLAGFYFYRQDAEASRRIFSGGNPLFFTDGPLDTTAYAGFANVTINPTEQLAITGGVRVTYEKKEGSYTQVSPVGPFNRDFPDLEISVTEPSWTGSVNYQWTEDFSTYASASRGFKSGGFNVDPLATTSPTLSAADITFQPEFVTSYEVGFKSTLADGRVQWSGAIFYSNYKDRQVAQTESLGGVPTVTFRNAGRARIWGIETDFAASVNEYLSIFGGMSYLNGEYQEFPNANAAGDDFTGNTTERTPEFSLSIGAEFRYPVGSAELVVAPQYAYQGETFLQPDNGPFNVEDGYSLINVKAGVEFNEGKYSVYFWGKNLTDAEYKEFARQFSGSDQVLFGEPRTYGVEFSASF